MCNNFFSVGITGGIGSGKSLICKIFLVLGVPVYSSDERAKWLLSHDDLLKNQIIQQFGEEAYDQEGKLNRSYLANTIFTDEERRQQLNALVHPRVGADFDKWRASCSASPYVLKEAALLFETGSYRQLDKIINVSAPKALRIQRVLLRDIHRSKEQLEAIMAKQWSDKQREELADFTIKNNEKELVLPEVIKIHKHLLKISY
ncbi:dephospho-CoA kinase [Catalinimonas alkaloidigena]|uniref:dephospho-CoA kinase n=1 Tax=Catalinimonas alkaloidigena TaxID=1075417 RepID=UPI002406CA5E|nr:dephospho-CoA kinase [Catalinimonas alkaloidigena]MDF9801030.1 dephospho-CoA kinase [Catalinimonas alkaloidigena]